MLRVCCRFVNLNTKGDNYYYYLMDFGYFCKSKWFVVGYQDILLESYAL